MSAFKIGGSPFRPANGVSNTQKPEKKVGETGTAAAKNGEFDTVNFRANRLAVMPRMSSLGTQSAQQAQGKAVESLLKDSAAELDDYFAGAYGFKE